MITIHHCPVCNCGDLHDFISVKDFTSSKETFKLKKCPGCELILTTPRPTLENLGNYYRSPQYISHSNNATSVTDRLYLIARTFTLAWKYHLVNKKGTSAKILDYGCGTGHFLHYCQQKGLDVHGVEPNELARTTANSLIPNQAVQKDLKQSDRDFDIITLWHVLEHVPDLNDTLKDLQERMSTKARVYIAVPNASSWDSEHYNEMWAAYDTPRHLWHFTKKPMTRLLQKNGLILEEIIPMKLDAYYVCLLSEKNRNNGKMRPKQMFNAVINGWKSNQKASATNNYSSLIYVARNEN